MNVDYGSSKSRHRCPVPVWSNASCSLNYNSLRAAAAMEEFDRAASIKTEIDALERSRSRLSDAAKAIEFASRELHPGWSASFGSPPPRPGGLAISPPDAARAITRKVTVNATVNSNIAAADGGDPHARATAEMQRHRYSSTIGSITNRIAATKESSVVDGSLTKPPGWVPVGAVALHGMAR